MFPPSSYHSYLWKLRKVGTWCHVCVTHRCTHTHSEFPLSTPYDSSKGGTVLFWKNRNILVLFCWNKTKPLIRYLSRLKDGSHLFLVLLGILSTMCFFSISMWNTWMLPGGGSTDVKFLSYFVRRCQTWWVKAWFNLLVKIYYKIQLISELITLVLQDKKINHNPNLIWISKELKSSAYSAEQFPEESTRWCLYTSLVLCLCVCECVCGRKGEREMSEDYQVYVVYENVGVLMLE